MSHADVDEHALQVIGASREPRASIGPRRRDAYDAAAAMSIEYPKWDDFAARRGSLPSDLAKYSIEISAASFH